MLLLSGDWSMVLGSVVSVLTGGRVISKKKRIFSLSSFCVSHV